MPRFISPPLEELSSLRTPLTPGEKKVLEVFDQKLPQEWDIYIQPHLNGSRPDFVLLNPQVGIAVFEVKDWNLTAMPYRVEYSQQGKPELWSTSRDGIDFRVKDNPVEKVIQYRDSIANLYCPRIAIKSFENYQYLAVITAGVIMTEATTQEVKKLFLPFQKSLKLLDKKEKYHPIVGKDALESKNLSVIFPSSQWRSSKYMESQLAQDLKHWLVEPDSAATQRQPLELDKKQLDLVKTRTNSGYRRIKGAAGSGKSLVLAGRAAQLSSEGKDILVVSYNITLWHYLRDLAVRYQIPDKRIKDITWCHFHDWCKRVCDDVGWENEYRELWKNPDNPDLEQILEFDLVHLVNEAIDKNANFIPSFDAILVDEGQDYNLDWWNTLRRVLRKGGEMLLVADETQDLYERTKYWTDESMKGAGFKGGVWVRLETCYRNPPTLIPYLRNFAQQYLTNISVNLPEANQQELNISPIQMRWIQVKNRDTSYICAEAVLNMPIWTESDTFSYSDIVVLVQDHKTGLKCIKLIEEKGIKTAHIFGTDYQEQKPRKLGFFMGDARVKASTIHSFKGWESCCMVININRTNSQEDLAAIYVALSRLKRRLEGSYLTVICSESKLEDFGKTWQMFEQR